MVAPLCALCAVLDGSAARAEAWVVVPVVVANDQEAKLAASQAARPVAEALGQHGRVVGFATARERFETRGSSPPVAATHGDLDQLARDAQQALYHVAMGLYTNASADVERVMTRADRALESLNRETIAAKQLLDACLFIVRARLQAKKLEEARKQAFECRRLVPDIEPEAAMHPPEVIGQLAAAEAELEMQKPGSLRVTSSPSGCPVYVQGRNLGQTPLELPRLMRGEYRVQVDCVPGQHGRVHRVTLGPSRTIVNVDSRFDAVVQTGDGVSLRYTSDLAQQREARAHGIEVGRSVGARHVALVTPEAGSEDRVRISSLEVAQGRLVASVIVRLDATSALVRGADAIAALVEGRSFDFTVEPAVPLIETPEVEPLQAQTSELALDLSLLSDSERSDDSDTNWIAWSAGGVGAAAYVASWILYAHQLSLESDYRKVRDLPDTSEAERRIARIESFELVPPILAFASAGVVSAALPFVLPESELSSPPAAVAVGGAGVLLAGVGAFFLIQAAGCETYDALGRCDDVLATTRFGGLLISGALPLLMTPVVYWIRGDAPSSIPESDDVSLEVSREGFVLGWRGRL
jgi:hypothetical protein